MTHPARPFRRATARERMSSRTSCVTLAAIRADRNVLGAHLVDRHVLRCRGPAGEEVERLAGGGAGFGGVDEERLAWIARELERLEVEGEVTDDGVEEALHAGAVELDVCALPSAGGTPRCAWTAPRSGPTAAGRTGRGPVQRRHLPPLAEPSAAEPAARSATARRTAARARRSAYRSPPARS